MNPLDASESIDLKFQTILALSLSFVDNTKYSRL